MNSLYHTLRQASLTGRRGIATRLVGEMQAGNPAANQAYYDLTWRTARELGRREPSVYDSTMLVTSTRRVGGFLQAIQRAPQAESAIDAGTGASALLAVATAVSHPRAEVFAYEIHPPAARCASAVIELFGLSDRIQVTTDDVLTAADLPEVDLAVTETFTSGLTVEVGTRITTALGRVAREVLPAFAQLAATDSKTPWDPNTDWYETTLIDLTENNDFITGEVESKARGRRPVSVYAEFLDARHQTVVPPGSKDLTDHITIGSIVVPRAGTTIGFSYPAAADLGQTPARLWVVQ